MQELSSSITVQNVASAYLTERRNPYAEKRCKTPQTLAVHLKAPIQLWGQMAVDDFAKGSKNRVREAVQAWRESGLAQGTVHKRISTLKSAFYFAVEEEIITRAQMPIIKVPPAGPPRERFVHPIRELPDLLTAAADIRTPDHINLFNEIALITGQRRQSINDLQWSNIDFDERVIRFRDTQEPGERSSKRRINQPMSDELYELLLRAKERAETDWVIEFRGKHVKSCYQGMKALFKRANLQNIHVHDLRRSSANYVHDELGGDIEKAASHLGDTRAVTMKHYVQPSTEVNKVGINAATSVLSRARAKAA